ncbi:sigma factor-like helix-turn-helix DNA-binding protein [Pseudidiomarina sp.]|uniref:sigma factor-like helix-turn-helix DNA-binding protein n=1 Tax=Pseudidiomarina sp. TaxID=2081707 RepID=UPI003A969099
MISRRAVLTGEVVDLPNETSDSRRHLSAHIELGLRLIHDYVPLSYDVFRGKHFVIQTAQASHALDIAMLLRLFLKSKQQQDDWDVRVGVGLTESLSNQALASLKKDRLMVLTGRPTTDDRLRLTTKFADALLSQLTSTQAQVLSYYLRFMPITHQELADKLNKSRVNVTQILNSTHYKLFELYLIEARQLLATD